MATDGQSHALMGDDARSGAGHYQAKATPDGAKLIWAKTKWWQTMGGFCPARVKILTQINSSNNDKRSHDE